MHCFVLDTYDIKSKGDFNTTSVLYNPKAYDAFEIRENILKGKKVISRKMRMQVVAVLQLFTASSFVSAVRG